VPSRREGDPKIMQLDTIWGPWKGKEFSIMNIETDGELGKDQGRV
jgi:hypothetical protein